MFKEITSLQHPLVKHFVRLKQNRDYREEHHSVVIEGNKIIHEVCKTHPTKAILACDSTLFPKGLSADQMIIVNEQIMKKISGVQSPEGLIAEVSLPTPSSLKGMKRILACDGINDPGNLGAILRTGLALGWDGAFILNNSCDPFNDKALRAAKGATFRLPLAHGSWDQLKEIVKANKLQPLVADMEGQSIDSLPAPKGVLLVLSNEAHGLSDEAKPFQKIKIPMPGEMESLNVAIAGAILMYLLKGKGNE